jgi:hypothetical protein
LAHERWVPHNLIHPVHSDIFRAPSWDMASVIIRTLIFFRLNRRLLAPAPGHPCPHNALDTATLPGVYERDLRLYF